MSCPVGCGLHGERLGVSGGFWLGDDAQLCLLEKLWSRRKMWGQGGS